MLEHLTFTGRELLLAVVLATVVYLFEVLLLPRRRKAVDAHSADSLRALEARLAELQARLEALEMRSAEGGAEALANPYADAIRLAGEGLPAPEIAQRLGISLTEAELISALRRAGP